ncbi:N-acylneuraminate-9-phosphatase [Nymphaea thermarum]|nr:N-acylneuraminate-9-phosphatase [Nymphaea thermarum]
MKKNVNPEWNEKLTFTVSESIRPIRIIDVTEWRAQLWHKALQEQGIDDIALARVMNLDIILMVRELQNQGIKTCIITNGHPKRKQTPSIFIKACELVGSRPEESVMVGDKLKTDVQGARNANLLAAVWVNVHGIVDIPEDVTARPSYTISNVIELPQVLSLIQ